MSPVPLRLKQPTRREWLSYPRVSVEVLNLMGSATNVKVAAMVNRLTFSFSIYGELFTVSSITLTTSITFIRPEESRMTGISVDCKFS